MTFHPRQFPGRWIIISIVVLTVLLLLATWFLWPDPGPDDHHTNPDALRMAVTQAELDEIAERQTYVSGEAVTDVVGTAHGALLVVADGVVAVSNEQWAEERDGHWPEQWRYLDESPVTDITVPPQGETALTHGRPGELGHSLTLLDSRTGELLGGATFGGRYDADDQLHLSPDAIVQQSGQTLTAHPLGHEGKRLTRYQEPIWSLATDQLCPGTAEPETAADITPSEQGFIVALRCEDPENASHTEVISHLDGRVSDERWRLEWHDLAPDTPRTQVHYMSPAVVPDSPDDVMDQLLDGDSNTSYALALEHLVEGQSEYFSPRLFEGRGPQDYFSVPLTDQADHPEVLIVGENEDVEPHMLFQAAKKLVNDPDVDFTHEDSAILHEEEEGATVEINTYREDPDPIAFKSPLEYAIRQALP